MAAWKVEVDGKTFYDSDLSLNDAAWISTYTGVAGWRAVAPLASPKASIACLAALLRRPDQSYDDAVAEVGEIKIDIVQCFTACDEDDLDRPATYSGGLPDPPKAAPTTG